MIDPLRVSQAVVIGASAGGLNALQTILKDLPNDLPGTVLIVQHRKAAAEDLLSSLLRQVCALPVQEASDKTSVNPSQVYVAPANYHLLVEMDKSLALSIDAPISYVRPAIDVVFETAAEAYAQFLIGVLLTGSNHDGTNGLRKIKAHGGITVAQDPTTAEARIMPQAAIDAGVVDHVLPLTEIAAFIVRTLTERF